MVIVAIKTYKMFKILHSLNAANITAVYIYRS